MNDVKNSHFPLHTISIALGTTNAVLAQGQSKYCPPHYEKSIVNPRFC